MRALIVFISCFYFFSSCNSDIEPSPLFVDRQDIGIDFRNDLEYTEEFNPYTYRNFYNGGGVSLGDINNDGLIDIYFTGNLVDNKLYLNKGNWQFEDITESAGVACTSVWSTGANFVDVNGDDLLDIYVCKGGQLEGENRHNELFINQGNLKFEESSAKYGLDIKGLSIQSAFFDYDKDGDLDCYLLNNSTRSIGGFDLKKGQRNIPTTTGNKFLENQNGRYVDVSEKAGIYTSAIGYGLGITLSDFNNDDWTDIYISNDFFEKDYLYINQKDGRFKEQSTSYFECLPLGAMGADAGDLNNDNYVDIMVTEMLPSRNATKKNKAIYDTWKKHSQMQRNGYYNQMPRNMLHANQKGRGFYDLGRRAGVEATDWSWSSLIFDFENDGLKDIFITNGIYKDLLDRDYLSFAANDSKIQSMIKTQDEALKNLIDSMPTQAVHNFAFKNKGDFLFDEVSKMYGFGEAGYSNGCAYGDLDNDGDLDLVVNNVNMPSHIFENMSNTLSDNNYLKIRLQGSSNNTSAIGSKVIAAACNQTFTTEQYPSRGFQSSVAHELLIGIGECEQLDYLEVIWPDGSSEIKRDIAVNQKLVFTQKDSKGASDEELSPIENGFAYDTLHSKKKSPQFNQFNREKLLYKMNASNGPAIVVDDFNGDGNKDVFIGGLKNKNSTMIFKDAAYKSIGEQELLGKSSSEVTAARSIDYDQDGDLDIYVGCGGTAFSSKAKELDDYILVNDGTGQFSVGDSKLKFSKTVNTSSVQVGDLNSDGKPDVFITGNNAQLTYGNKGSGYILLNEENEFRLSQENLFQNIGIISDSAMRDINGDGLLDIIIVGEWMGVKLYLNSENGFFDATKRFGLENLNGLWNHVNLVDINQDQKPDLIIGNVGTNSAISTSHVLAFGDFDSNGFSEQILCEKIRGKLYPVVDKDELFSQLPHLKKKYVYYRDYASASMDDLFNKDVLRNIDFYSLNTLESKVLLNEGTTFSAIGLPPELNYSSIHTSEVFDYDSDGDKDIFVGGNHYLFKPQFGGEDASDGWLFECKSDSGGISFEPHSLGIDGEIRSIELYNNSKIIFGANGGEVLTLSITK